MSKFTPGKWEAEEIYGHYIVGVGNKVIAECYKNDADAYLMAAAPEMYEFLVIASEDRFVSRNAMMRMARKLLTQIDRKEREKV